MLGAVLVLCGLIGLPLRWRPPVATAALIAFVVLARPSPSVLRAAAMGGIAMVALATGSRRQALPALCGAVLAAPAASRLSSPRKPASRSRPWPPPGCC